MAAVRCARGMPRQVLLGASGGGDVQGVQERAQVHRHRFLVDGDLRGGTPVQPRHDPPGVGEPRTGDAEHHGARHRQRQLPHRGEALVLMVDQPGPEVIPGQPDGQGVTKPDGHVVVADMAGPEGQIGQLRCLVVQQPTDQVVGWSQVGGGRHPPARSPRRWASAMQDRQVARWPSTSAARSGASVPSR